MEIDQPLVQRILRDYELGSVKSVEPHESGFQGDNAKLQTTEGKFVVRNLRTEPVEINKMMYIYEFLGTHDFPTAKPIRTVAGNYFTEVGVDRFVVQNLIGGNSPLTENKDKTRKITKLVGRTMASFHGILRDIDTEQMEHYDPDWKSKDIINHLNGVELDNTGIFFPELRATLEDDYVVEQYQHWLASLDKLDIAELTMSICHNDLKLNDLRLDNGELTGVLDFDTASYNYQLYDIASFMMYTKLYQPKIANMFLSDLISSYIEESKVGYHEMEQLRFFLHSRFLFQVFLFFTRVEAGLTRGTDTIEQNKAGMNDGINLLKTLETIEPGFYVQLLEGFAD